MVTHTQSDRGTCILVYLQLVWDVLNWKEDNDIL